MQQTDIEKALGEVLSIAKEMCVERTYVASCDTQATFHGDVRSTTSLELVGGGGTSLEKALEVIRTNRIDPTVVVFLTDGQTTWSNSPPEELARRYTIVVTPRGNPPGPEWAESIST
jgi:predicted metal-dependent peptidase